MIYLDNNATTRIDPRVVAAMTDVFHQRLANPTSQHAAGRDARRILQAAIDDIASVLNCRQSGMAADQIILTSGGTEANNLAIQGLATDRLGDIVVSGIEHSSILETAREWGSRNSRTIRTLPAKADGSVCLETWKRWLSDHDQGLSPRLALVSVMHGNNETGVLQPIEGLANDCRSRGILFHTDAVQTVGKLTLDFSKLGCDAMTISGHKLHGPVGIGALIVRAATPIAPVMFGGFQQLNRPGTESVALAVGLAKALTLYRDEQETRTTWMEARRQQLEELLLQQPFPPTIIGHAASRLPHTLCLAYPGLNRQALQMTLDREGIACSTGSACASGSGQPSHVLMSMGLDRRLVEGAIRLSLSHETTTEEITAAAAIIARVTKNSYEKL
jgi:cysteine desulfurase